MTKILTVDDSRAVRTIIAKTLKSKFEIDLLLLLCEKVATGEVLYTVYSAILFSLVSEMMSHPALKIALSHGKMS